VTDGHPRTFPTTAVFTWATKDRFDFLFGDAMVVDVRLTSRRIAVEAKIHAPCPYYVWWLLEPEQPFHRTFLLDKTL